MPTFGEYSSDSAYFIAGGETLEIIKQFEEDAKNYKAQLDAIATEHGAHSMYDSGFTGFIFTFHQTTNHPALSFDAEYEGRNGNPARYLYKVNKETAEGRALQERLEDIPPSERSYGIFSKRLTGVTTIETNPDNVRDPEDFRSSAHYKLENRDFAAKYQKYGDAYVVEVPRTIRGIGIQFNEAAECKTASGYEYDWFTPPDSKPVSYSQVVALQEKELGDQLQRRQVKAKLEVITLRS